MRTTSFPSVLLVAVTGCIAGAQLDSPSRKREAQNFPTTVGAGVTVVKEPKAYGSSAQVVPARLTSFAQSAHIEIGEKRRVGDILVQFALRRIVVEESDRTILDRILPDAFDMHGLTVGIDEFQGRRVLVLVTSTRASTGRYYVGIFDTSGEVFFEASLPGADVWDVQKFARGILIIGSDCDTKIILPE